jgi:hypothetical protein
VGRESTLRRVPWLVRPRREWAEEGVGGFEELAEAASSMCVREGSCHGEVAIDYEACSGDGVFVTSMKDMP